MNRIHTRLQGLQKSGDKALSLFVTAGYPQRDSLMHVVPCLEKGGADIIEIGMPFSDPLADGPAIQQSSTAAIQNGMTLPILLEQVAKVRSSTSLPLVLMGYLNPILRFGTDRFFTSAAAAGIDGIILPELPLEEAERYKTKLEEASIAQIFLVSPTTPHERMLAIDSASSGFVYCVSRTGVTGGSAEPDTRYLKAVRSAVTKNPLLVGFGISEPGAARAVLNDADGIIIGSALIRLLGDNPGDTTLVEWVESFVQCLGRNASHGE